MNTYSVVFTQYVASEYGDGEDAHYVQKEFNLPFIPSDHRLGFIIPDLGPYVIHTNGAHYDMNDGKFYVTIQANWVQVWKDREYDFTATKMELEKELTRLRSLGWDVVKKVYETI